MVGPGKRRHEARAIAAAAVKQHAGGPFLQLCSRHARLESLGPSKKGQGTRGVSQGRKCRYFRSCMAELMPTHILRHHAFALGTGNRYGHFLLAFTCPCIIPVHYRSCLCLILSCASHAHPPHAASCRSGHGKPAAAAASSIRG